MSLFLAHYFFSRIISFICWYFSHIIISHVLLFFTCYYFLRVIISRTSSCVGFLTRHYFLYIIISLTLLFLRVIIFCTLSSTSYWMLQGICFTIRSIVKHIPRTLAVFLTHYYLSHVIIYRTLLFLTCYYLSHVIISYIIISHALLFLTRYYFRISLFVARYYFLRIIISLASLFLIHYLSYLLFLIYHYFRMSLFLTYYYFSYIIIFNTLLFLAKDFKSMYTSRCLHIVNL